MRMTNEDALIAAIAGNIIGHLVTRTEVDAETYAHGLSADDARIAVQAARLIVDEVKRTKPKELPSELPARLPDSRAGHSS